jgi:hypothetical protein
MRILYLTGDTRIRASAFSLFIPLYRELERTGVVDIKEFNSYTVYGDKYKEQIFQNNNVDFIRPQLDVEYINSAYNIVIIENMFPYWNEQWDRITAKKLLVLGDLHRFNPKTGKYKKFMFRVIERIGIDAILTKYIETYEKDYKNIDLPVYHWPHSIDPTCFHDYGQKKEYGILSTGMLNDNVYPIRRKMYNLLKNKAYFKRIDRPNNRTDKYPNPWPVGINYAMELNKAKMSIACTSKYHYTIAKIFEIPACNSVLLCDYTDEMKRLGFIPDVNFIKIRDDISVSYIESLLKDEERLQEISAAGYKMVHERHTTKQRVNELIDYCKDM